MIHNQALRLATWLVKKELVDEKSHEVYAYGFELIISAFINILLIAIISILTRCYYDWLLFLIAFIPLRTTTGGYHANSHFKCIIIGTMVYTALLFLSRLQINWSIIILVISVLSLILVLALSPIEARNKKLNLKQKSKNRKISICITVFNLLITIVIFFDKDLTDILNIYFAGVFSATLSMLVVKVKKPEGGGEHEICKKLVS